VRIGGDITNVADPKYFERPININEGDTSPVDLGSVVLNRQTPISPVALLKILAHSTGCSAVRELATT
jgi:hypothetical protein